MQKQAQRDKGNSQSQKFKTNPTRFKFVYLGQERLDEAAHLMTESLIQQNKVWHQMRNDFDELKSLRRLKILYVMKSKLAFGMIDQQTNELACFSYRLDLVDFINYKQQIPYKSKFLFLNNEYSKKVRKEEFEKLQPSLKRGEIVVGGGASNVKYLKSGVMKQFIPLALINLKILGYKYSYGISANKVVTRLYCSFGAKVVNQIPMIEQGFENQSFKLYRVDLNSLHFNSLSQFLPEAEEDQLQEYQ